MKTRPRNVRLRRRTELIAAIAAAVCLTAAIVVVTRVGHETGVFHGRSSLESERNATTTPLPRPTFTPRLKDQPQEVSLNAPAVAATTRPGASSAAAAVNISRDYAADFAGDVVDVRTQLQGVQAPAPATVAEPCLLSWARTHLAVLAAKGSYALENVCGRATVVLAGPAGSDSKVLVYGAMQPAAPAGVKALLAGSTSKRMAFVAVRSSDGKAQLLAAAVLPDHG